MAYFQQNLPVFNPGTHQMDAIIAEALALGNPEVRDLALEIRNHENDERVERDQRFLDLGVMIQKIKHPEVEFKMSDIVTVIEAAPDEEAQLQAFLTTLAKRGEWDPLIVELAIATVDSQDMDGLVSFLESLAINKIEHSKVAHGRSLVKCVACEEELQPKSLVLTSCGHCYCGSCLNIVFNAAISDESLYPPRCCANTPIPREHADRFLDAELIWTFEDKRVEFSTVDRTYCSDPTCSTFIPQDDYDRGAASCPNCSKRTRVACKAPGHEGDCPTDYDLAELLKYAQEMHWQRCYNCLRVVQRQDGCNFMDCRCGAAFCYNCGRELNYDDESRCPCQNYDPPAYSFYRRPADRWQQPPESPRTNQEDAWVEGPATDWDLPEPGPIWDFTREDGEDTVRQEQDISRAGTPAIPQFEAQQADDLDWAIWTAQIPDFTRNDNGE